jgi:hypothetical protein
MEKALCAELDIPLNHFFDDYLRSLEVFNQVNDLCMECQVRDICFRYGETTKSTGVWGGKWLSFGQVVQVELDYGDGDAEEK